MEPELPSPFLIIGPIAVENDRFAFSQHLHIPGHGENRPLPPVFRLDSGDCKSILFVVEGDGLDNTLDLFEMFFCHVRSNIRE